MICRVFFLVLCCGLVCRNLAAQKNLPNLPTAEATKIRELFTRTLSLDEKAKKDLMQAARTFETRYKHDSLVDALRLGPLLPSGSPKPRGKGKTAERFETFDAVTTGFVFRHGEDEYRYAVDIPPGYSARKPAPLVLDPGHGSGAREDQKGKAGFLGYFRHRADAAGLSGALIVRTEIIEQIGADGLRGAKPEDQVTAVFDAFFRDVFSRFAVDLNRVFVTGLSQTGFWAWQLGVSRPDRFTGIAPMGAVTWGTNGYLANLGTLSVYVLHGDSDKTCPVAQPRKTSGELKDLGIRVHYEEIAGGKHDYSTWQHLDKGLTWLAEVPRRTYPKKLAFHVQTTSQPWCHWVRIDRIKTEGPGKAGRPPVASVDVEVRGQEIHVRSSGVEEMSLFLAPELVDFAAPVRVVVNGTTKFEKTPTRSFVCTLETAIEKAEWFETFDFQVSVKP